MGIVGVPLQLTLTLIPSMDSALTEVSSCQDSNLKLWWSQIHIVNAKIICSQVSAVHNQILFFSLTYSIYSKHLTAYFYSIYLRYVMFYNIIFSPHRYSCDWWKFRRRAMPVSFHLPGKYIHFLHQ